MKTKNKNNNAFRAPSHPEQLSTDTNPRKLYKVSVHRIDHRFMKIRSWGDSKADAEDNAKKAAWLKDESKWRVADTNLYAFDAEQVKEGGRHE